MPQEIQQSKPVELLTQTNLNSAGPAVVTPKYNRNLLGRGIVHMGLGAFHRAHQAFYTEKLIVAGDMRWGILGVSLRDPAPAALMHAQNGLYSVTERHGETAHTWVIGALHGALHAPSALEQVLKAIADPQVSIVSSTVTEKGYCQSPATADLDLKDPGILHDLRFPDAPVTVLGVLAAGIRRRPASAPLTLLCCDNMAANGDKLRKLLVQYAEHLDTGLAQRIEHDIGAPNSMVDRIVPAATPDSLSWASGRLGLRDEAAIVCEPFTQWVIEDRFTSARPAWEDVGVVLTADVRPYQEMKLRLLNGTHSAIAYAGQLCGLATVSDVMRDPEVSTFVRRLMLEDLRNSVTCPPGYDIASYCNELLERFNNPSLAHKTEQIAMDGTQKVPVRWLPAIRESLASGQPLSALERALAMWLFYLDRQKDAAGNTLTVNDVGAHELIQLLRSTSTTLDFAFAALGYAKVFGQTEWPPSFVERLVSHLTILREKGIYALINACSPTTEP